MRHPAITVGVIKGKSEEQTGADEDCLAVHMDLLSAVLDLDHTLLPVPLETAWQHILAFKQQNSGTVCHPGFSFQAVPRPDKSETDGSQL